MCLYALLCVQECSWKPEERVGSPGAGVIGYCELPNIGTRIPTLNCRAISPGKMDVFDAIDLTNSILPNSLNSIGGQ